jgi:prepilin-type N-terminal cleavage/methylation domain-containing protein
MKPSQQGFTLVEIAIVLVIIGLLLGGILKGQEMITQAKIKNVVSDFSGISAAYYGYQDRYRAIPGDDQQAATRWAVAPAATLVMATASWPGGTTTGALFARPISSRAAGGITCVVPASSRERASPRRTTQSRARLACRPATLPAARSSAASAA